MLIPSRSEPTTTMLQWIKMRNQLIWIFEKYSNKKFQPTIEKNEFEFLTKSESNSQLRSVLCLRRPRGKPPLEPQPLPYRGAIWPGASRVTEDCSPLVPGCTIPIEALMAINIYCSPIGTPIGTPETSSYRGLLSQLLAKVIEAIASLQGFRVQGFYQIPYRDF